LGRLATVQPIPSNATTSATAAAAINDGMTSAISVTGLPSVTRHQAQLSVTELIRRAGLGEQNLQRLAHVGDNGFWGRAVADRAISALYSKRAVVPPHHPPASRTGQSSY
jgi:hypothetical protein